MRSSPPAYLLWFGCLIGFAGLHRFYLGRPWSGLLWLLTFGLLGIGQLVDLFLIPGMVREGALEPAVGGRARATAGVNTAAKAG